MTTTLGKSRLAKYWEEMGLDRPPALAGGATVRPEGLEAAGPPAPVIPFNQASKRVTEEGPFWTGIEPGAAEIKLEAKPILANGFLAAIWAVLKTTTAGTNTEAATAGQAYPWCIIHEFQFKDQGGKEIDSAMGGFEWWLACRFGGYNGLPDLSELDSFEGTSLTAPAFTLLVPQALSPSSWGSLTNQTEATHYFVQPMIAPTSTIYKGKISKAPIYSLKLWIQYWNLPAARTPPEPGGEFPEGIPQEQRIPGEGTLQAWTRQANVKIEQGENPTLITRVGQLIRTIILVTRNSSGEFSEKILPDPFRIMYEREEWRSLERQRCKDQAKEMTQGPQKAIPTGVYPFILSEGNTGWVAGSINPNTYLSTNASTRLEIKGNSEEKGSMDIIVNDVSVSAVTSQGRREFAGLVQGAGAVA